MTASRQLQPAAGRARWDERVPPPLRPLLRAYALGYASAVVPRLLTLLLQQASKRKTKGDDAARPPSAHESFVGSLRRILREGLDLRRFPTFCAAVVGGSTLLEVRGTGHARSDFVLNHERLSHLFRFSSADLYLGMPGLSPTSTAKGMANPPKSHSSWQ